MPIFSVGSHFNIYLVQKKENPLHFICGQTSFMVAHRERGWQTKHPRSCLKNYQINPFVPKKLCKYLRFHFCGQTSLIITSRQTDRLILFNPKLELSNVNFKHKNQKIMCHIVILVFLFWVFKLCNFKNHKMSVLNYVY